MNDRGAAVWTCVCLFLLSLPGPGGGQDSTPGEEKKVLSPIDLRCPQADLPQLAAEIEAATGLKSFGEENILLLIRIGEDVRILPKRELTPAELEGLRTMVLRHRPVHPGAEWGWKDGFPPKEDRARWSKLYEQAGSDSDRIELLARYVGLRE